MDYATASYNSPSTSHIPSTTTHITCVPIAYSVGPMKSMMITSAIFYAILTHEFSSLVI